MNEYDDYVDEEISTMWMYHEDYTDVIVELTDEVTDEDIEWACSH
jgi:hypothetical protein